MRVIKSLRQMQNIVKQARALRKKIGLVPTMGALHHGHLSLIRSARRDCSIAVVSIFVNPAQFAPKEDLKRYPRPVKKDLALCLKEKVDFVFLPQQVQMYPEGFSTFVDVEKLGALLCGKSRPRHFRGVATVVAKLFNIVQPDIAYFGQKDAQQAVVIRRMCQDLNFPLKLKVLPTIRDRDGLALSSRNAYLSKGQRQEAVVLFKALKLAQALIRHGASDSAAIIRRMKELVNKKKSARIEYIAIVNPDNLMPLKRVGGNCLIALAVRIGNTRLIDNINVSNRRVKHVKAK